MAESYDHKKIEKRWQAEWEKSEIYKTSNKVPNKENFYTLVEFPYPSGNLHVGHWYAFSLPDIYARFRRMQGFNVLYPIGFDAFGLPAENAAIKRNLNPKTWTEQNIAYMKNQIKSMGTSFDWSREISTIDPNYYKWTQWLFLQLHKNNLVYQKETPANWCPSCKTVLANEQVVAGFCERCDSEVEIKNILQWNIKITDYAQRLIDDLEELDWPKEIKESQKNWIGKKEGYTLNFDLLDVPNQKDGEHKVEVFTTRPDTLFGVTFLAISPKLAESWINKGWQASEETQSFIKKTLGEKNKDRFADKEKEGVFSGLYAQNPVNQEKVPVWVVNYVLDDVGTGAIMAVPAHDERDFDFAKKYNLEINEVVSGGDIKKEAYTKSGKIINSGQFNGLSNEEAKVKIAEKVSAKKETFFKLRDWGVSRQRYWGVPIPIIHCDKCGSMPVPDQDLPVVLPEVEDYLPTGDGKSPLAKVSDWVNVKCPKCSEGAKRETDTLDTFVDSSWYFLRYTDPNNEQEFASKENILAWLPVDLYSGGSEHTTMHVLYSRFWHKALFDLGLVPEKEPYKKRLNRGLILGPDGNKMSKSKGNVIDPDELVEKLGADTVRVYLAFIGPFNEAGSYPWSIDGIAGARRFLEKIWNLKERIAKEATVSDEIILNQTIKKVTEEIESLKLNTGVSALMVFLNHLMKQKAVSQKEYETFILLLSPFAPYLAEELWSLLGYKKSIHLEKWPEYDTEMITSQEIELVIQINGKVRESLNLKRGENQDVIENMAKNNDKIAKYLEGKEIKKVIFVPDKLINFVLDN